MVLSSGQPATIARTTSMGTRNSQAARRRWRVSWEASAGATTPAVPTALRSRTASTEAALLPLPVAAEPVERLLQAGQGLLRLRLAGEHVVDRVPERVRDLVVLVAG